MIDPHAIPTDIVDLRSVRHVLAVESDRRQLSRDATMLAASDTVVLNVRSATKLIAEVDALLVRSAGADASMAGTRSAIGHTAPLGADALAIPPEALRAAVQDAFDEHLPALAPLIRGKGRRALPFSFVKAGLASLRLRLLRAEANYLALPDDKAAHSAGITPDAAWYAFRKMRRRAIDDVGHARRVIAEIIGRRGYLARTPDLDPKCATPGAMARSLIGPAPENATVRLRQLDVLRRLLDEPADAATMHHVRLQLVERLLWPTASPTAANFREAADILQANWHNAGYEQRLAENAFAFARIFEHLYHHLSAADDGTGVARVVRGELGDVAQHMIGTNDGDAVIARMKTMYHRAVTRGLDPHFRLHVIQNGGLAAEPLPDQEMLDLWKLPFANERSVLFAYVCSSLERMEAEHGLQITCFEHIIAHAQADDHEYLGFAHQRLSTFHTANTEAHLRAALGHYQALGHQLFQGRLLELTQQLIDRNVDEADELRRRTITAHQRFSNVELAKMPKNVAFLCRAHSALGKKNAADRGVHLLRVLELGALMEAPQSGEMSESVASAKMEIGRLALWAARGNVPGG